MSDIKDLRTLVKKAQSDFTQQIYDKEQRRIDVKDSFTRIVDKGLAHAYKEYLRYGVDASTETLEFVETLIAERDALKDERDMLDNKHEFVSLSDAITYALETKGIEVKDNLAEALKYLFTKDIENDNVIIKQQEYKKLFDEIKFYKKIIDDSNKSLKTLKTIEKLEADIEAEEAALEKIKNKQATAAEDFDRIKNLTLKKFPTVTLT